MISGILVELTVLSAEIRITCLEHHLYIVSVVFVNVKDNQLFWGVDRDLADNSLPIELPPPVTNNSACNIKLIILLLTKKPRVTLGFPV